MKKIGIFLLCGMMLFIMCGCSGKEGMSGLSEEMKELGIAAVEIADNFLDGKITGEEAVEKLEKNSFMADLQYDMEKKEAEKDTEARTDYKNGSLVTSSILLLKISICDKNDGTGTEKDIIENRNNLAEIVGVSKE